MHVEVLIEDSSGERLLRALLPKVFDTNSAFHTWRVHSYRGIGRIPKGLANSRDPSKRMLLDQLPRLLKGYAKTPGYDAVVVVLDSDKRICKEFLKELKAVSDVCAPKLTTLFRLAIEEVEAWYFGDQTALLKAYPRAKRDVLGGYVQDSVCDTWELLADAVYPGGSAGIKKSGWPLPGQVKHEWAERIGPLMTLDENASPSFGKFRDGIRRLVEHA